MQIMDVDEGTEDVPDFRYEIGSIEDIEMEEKTGGRKKEVRGGAQILIIDDQKIHRSMVGDFIGPIAREFDWRCKIVESAVEAKEEIRQQKLKEAVEIYEKNMREQRRKEMIKEIEIDDNPLSLENARIKTSTLSPPIEIDPPEKMDIKNPANEMTNMALYQYSGLNIIL